MRNHTPLPSRVPALRWSKATTPRAGRAKIVLDLVPARQQKRHTTPTTLRQQHKPSKGDFRGGPSCRRLCYQREGDQREADNTSRSKRRMSALAGGTAIASSFLAVLNGMVTERTRRTNVYWVSQLPSFITNPLLPPITLGYPCFKYCFDRPIAPRASTEMEKEGKGGLGRGDGGRGKC